MVSRSVFRVFFRLYLQELFDPLARSSHFRISNFLASLSVALGVASLIVTNSVMSGFLDKVQKTVLNFHGQVIVMSRGQDLSKEADSKILRLAQSLYEDHSQVTAVLPYFFSETIVSTESASTGVVLEAIKPDGNFQQFGYQRLVVGGRLDDLLVRSSDQTPAVCLGQEVLKKLGAKLGDDINFTFPLSASDSLSLRAHIVCLLALGTYEYDSKYVLMAYDALKAFGSLNHRDLPVALNALKVNTKNEATSYELAGDLHRLMGSQFKVKDWTELHHNLLYAVKLEKVVLTMILFLIVLVASFNIVSVIMMFIYRKEWQLALLRSLGVKVRSYFFSLLGFGAILVLIGLVLGCLLGGLLLLAVERGIILKLPSDIYMVSTLPVQWSLSQWSLWMLLTALLSLVATAIPCYAFSRTQLSQGLKFNDPS